MEPGCRFKFDRTIYEHARTIYGLWPDARTLAFTFEHAWDEEPDQLDWDQECVRRFVETVCALAGVAPLPATA